MIGEIPYGWNPISFVHYNLNAIIIGLSLTHWREVRGLSDSFRTPYGVWKLKQEKLLAHAENVS